MGAALDSEPFRQPIRAGGLHSFWFLVLFLRTALELDKIQLYYDTFVLPLSLPPSAPPSPLPNKTLS